MEQKLFLLLLIGAILCFAAFKSQTVDATNNNNNKDNKRYLSLPKLFDFNHFKQIYKKVYSSLGEELARQKLFLARAYNVFISLIKYKHYKSDIYLRVNERSDWTQNEWNRSYVPGYLLKETFKSMKSGKELNSNGEEKSSILPVAVDLEDIKSELENIEKNHPDLDRTISNGIKLELENVDKKQQRSKRSLENKREQLSIEDVEPKNETPDNHSNLVHGLIKSNNENYSPPELMSCGSDEAQNELKSLPNDEVERINLSSKEYGIKYLNQILKQSMSTKTIATSGSGGDRSQEANMMFVDHRSCFPVLPKMQGECGSCFIFSTMALYEWLYCYYTGNKVEFSEGYVKDCGGMLKPNPLKGCAGGHPYYVSLFVKEFGLELGFNYPYRQIQEECPYEQGTDPKTMGYLRVNEEGFKSVPDKNLDTILERSPLVVGIATPGSSGSIVVGGGDVKQFSTQSFELYGGGVHNPQYCDPENGHAMLLVGRGREDNQEYYLFRNSYSISWGEQGYYKMSREAFYKCKLTEGFASTAYFTSAEETKNRNYNARPVLQKQLQFSMS